MGVSRGTGKAFIQKKLRRALREVLAGRKAVRRKRGQPPTSRAQNARMGHPSADAGTGVGPLSEKSPCFAKDARHGAPNFGTDAPFVSTDHDAKRRGELVEMMFMVEASRRGLVVSKPYGDSRRYDFITDAGRRLWRVQVKSSAHRAGRGFLLNATSRRHSRQVYTAEEIDFLIGYVVPRDVWYVVPVAELRSSTFRVYPDGCRRGGRYEKYREAWELLQKPLP